MKPPVIRLFLGLLLGACLARPAQAAELTVFAAASLSDALQEIGRAYESAGGDTVQFNLAASSTLARQIREGAPADIFFSADEAKMDGLAQAGLVAPGTRRSLLSNTLVVIVPSGTQVAKAGPGYLARPEVRRIALAEPTTVPAGIYARAWLQRTGLWPRVADKIVPVENVRACLAAVESGNVDAGVVYRTDALLSHRVRIIHEVAARDGPAISYPLAVLKASGHSLAARRFAAYLESSAAMTVFTRFGFTAAP